MKDGPTQSSRGGEPRLVTPRDTLHTLFVHDGRLCLRCRACEHRASLTLDARRSDMTPLSRLALRCSACGAADVEMRLPANSEQAAAFLTP